jgi:murein DD-endopeptidase MepM/ murein hydrolase activator NlpD
MRMPRLTNLISVLIVLAGCGLGWWIWTQRPTILIRAPQGVVGLTSNVVLRVIAPGATLSGLDVYIEQGGKTFPVYSLEPGLRKTVTEESADLVDVTRHIGKQAIPGLQSGQARIVVRASRSVIVGLPAIKSTVTRQVRVDFEPPRVQVRSTGHRVSHGGTELVLFRVAPPDVQSGVRVGDRTYPGFSASLAGLTADEALRISVFALHRDQDPSTPIEVFAEDATGRRAVVKLDHQVSQEPLETRRIVLDNESLRRSVSAIDAADAGIQGSVARQDLLNSFLTSNRALRRRDEQALEKLAGQTMPAMVWEGAFGQPSGAAVGTKFGEARIYVHNGKEVDREVYLGIDLPIAASDPTIRAAQKGVVVHAGSLGTYGNAVILDHGFGVQSLYGHLRSIAVELADVVLKEQALGRAGVTETSGSGDPVQFMLMVSGHPVNPAEWFDPTWMREHVQRRIDEAAATVEPTR